MRRINKVAAVATATLVFLVAGVGVALAAGASKTYRGTTSQNQAFKLVRSGKTVKKISFNWVGSCQGSTKKLTVPFSATSLSVTGGKFSDTTPGYALSGKGGLYGAVEIKKLSGKVNKSKSTGSYSFQGLIFSTKKQFGVCTGTGTWHATAK